MNFKELFDRAVLTENHVRKDLKVFYEIDLELIKPKEENNIEQISAQQNAPQPPAVDVSQTPEIPQTEPAQQPEMQPAQEQQTNIDTPTDTTNDLALPSVNTELNEDEVSSNEDNKIIRKFEGVVSLTDSEKDNIQSFDDVIDVLSKHKKDGTNVLDEFCTEIITLCANQNFNELKTKLDKKSKIFLEIYYGYNKDDSVGVRFHKRQNADTLTSTMMIDNEIVAAKFSIDRVSQKIAEYRNYEAKKS